MPGASGRFLGIRVPRLPDSMRKPEAIKDAKCKNCLGSEPCECRIPADCRCGCRDASAPPTKRAAR